MRRLFFALLLMLLPLADARAALPSDQAVLARATDYLKSIGRVRYELTVERQGVSAGGRAYIDRPSRRARIEIDQPFRDLVLVSGPVIHFKGGNGTITNQATRASPLRLLFLPDVDLARDAKLIGIERRGDVVAITLEQPETPRAGQITLRFVDVPQWALVGWDYVDPQGVRGNVRIDYVRTDGAFSNDLLRMPDELR